MGTQYQDTYNNSITAPVPPTPPYVFEENTRMMVCNNTVVAGNAVVQLCAMTDTHYGNVGSVVNGKFKPTEDGLYLGIAYLNIQGGNSTGIRRAYIQVNGGNGYPVPITHGTVQSVRPPNIEAVDITVNSQVMDLTTADEVGLYGYQDGGGNLNIATGSWLQIIKVDE